ncbi:MAG: biotin--[acetyl-CoA-carboxylase] ligase [Bacteroidetes bacterium GWE2_29_8]|nr:MAG: biotin--[acetyl-CoA-carboxylase] ligase [Bacteroidetes bacterium GWE2_29_8]OFY15646.1 MAG: biotin--[acetyl-CoA-carboxylase] ligase [Bacteroidetes bacterium GWF2_29_10]
MNLSIIKLNSVNSTNIYASQYAENNKHLLKESISLFYASEQLNGKGLGTNKWESNPEENITFSILFDLAQLHTKEFFFINKFFSISILEFVKSIISNKNNLKIKWPNDIYFENKKIAGILIENRIEGNYFKYSIAGAGININQERFSIDIPNPISITNITSLKYDIEVLINNYSSYFQKWYEIFLTRNYKLLDDIFFENLYLLNQPSKFIVNNIVIEGIIKGVRQNGMLIMDDKNGMTKLYDFKQIKYCI